MGKTVGGAIASLKGTGIFEKIITKVTIKLDLEGCLGVQH